ncbi:MAG: hypothetical protein ACKVQA_26270, partial [Burkholderiales bacterium]
RARSRGRDKLHQPYRQCLIPGMGEVQKAAIEAGALGVVISGAGPTLLAVGWSELSESIGKAMETAWQTANIHAVAKVLSLDTQGTTTEVKLP